MPTAIEEHPQLQTPQECRQQLGEKALFIHGTCYEKKDNPFVRKLSIQPYHRNTVQSSIEDHTHTILLKEEEAYLHELGHVVAQELVFGNTLKDSDKKPHFSEAEQYSLDAYVADQPNAGEGWAESFASYIQRPRYLQRRSPSLYRYWQDVFKKNPELQELGDAGV